MLLQDQLAGIVFVGIIVSIACCSLVCMTIQGAARLIFEGIRAASMKEKDGEKC